MACAVRGLTARRPQDPQSWSVLQDIVTHTHHYAIPCSNMQIVNWVDWIDGFPLTALAAYKCMSSAHWVCHLASSLKCVAVTRHMDAVVANDVIIIRTWYGIYHGKAKNFDICQQPYECVLTFSSKECSAQSSEEAIAISYDGKRDIGIQYIGLKCLEHKCSVYVECLVLRVGLYCVRLAA